VVLKCHTSKPLRVLFWHDDDYNDHDDNDDNDISFSCTRALTLLVRQQDAHPACKKNLLRLSSEVLFGDVAVLE